MSILEHAIFSLKGHVELDFVLQQTLPVAEHHKTTSDEGHRLADSSRPKLIKRVRFLTD